MKMAHVTSIYYYFNIVKMAASTVQMAAAIVVVEFVFHHAPVLFVHVNAHETLPNVLTWHIVKQGNHSSLNPMKLK